jgi:hypothetical protein
MKIRVLKIAVSSAGLLAFVIGIALWVRSYSTADTLRWNGSLAVFSRECTITTSYPTAQFAGAPTWQWKSTSPDLMGQEIGRQDWHLRLGNNTFIRFPYRLPVALFVLIAVAPWLHWHFSLRTVLIVTTVIALLLGPSIAKHCSKRPLVTAA